MIESFWESLRWFQQLPSLIAPDDTWTLWAMILVGVAFHVIGTFLGVLVGETLRAWF